MAEDVYNIRKGLADLVDALDDEDDNTNNERYMNLTQCDVTGSLGVWGIAH